MEIGRRRIVASFLAGSLGTALSRGAGAKDDTLPESEKVILTVLGRISKPNAADGSAQFTRPALESLGIASLRTRTPWYDTAVTFEGVPMTALMAAIGAHGDTLHVHAINDYVTDIPITDFSTLGVLLALKRDGRYMPVRDKGPLFIVYPYDKDPDLQCETYYERSAWQVDRMTVV